MALVNHVKKEINAKIVYYGPEGAGKAASLRYIYDRIRPELRGQLNSVPVIGSSLLFFDFIPFRNPVFGDYRVRFHIYTLPARVDNPASWKMILKGIDGLVIVCDASPSALPAGRGSVAQLREILDSYGVGLDDIPAVLQLNRAEQSDRTLVESAVRGLGLHGFRVCPASAAGGEGVLETLATLSRFIMGRIGKLDEIPGEFPGSSRDSISDFPPVYSDPPVTTENQVAQVVSQGYPGNSSSATVTMSPGVGQVAVELEKVNVDKGKVEIPLVFSTPDGGRQRLVVTVMVTAG